MRVDLVGSPSQTSWVDPRYRARNNTPSIKTEESLRRAEIFTEIYQLNFLYDSLFKLFTKFVLYYKNS